MAPPVLGLYHLTMVGEHDGQQTQNGFYFTSRNTSPADTNQEEAEHLADDFQEWIYPIFQEFSSDEWHVRGLIVTTLIPHLGPVVEKGILNSGGIQGNGSLPTYSAAVLAIRTGFSGRSARGRLYVAGVPKDYCLDSRLSDDGITRLQSIGDNLLIRYGPSGTNTRVLYGLYSRKLGDTRSAGPPPSITAHMAGFTNVHQTIARREIYTQRKRLLGRGV